VDRAGLWREQLEAASPDVLRAMVKMFAEALMSAHADAACGAGYGERSEQRVNSRNGYRAREWDTRAGTVELAIPKLPTGSYFPGLAVAAPPPRRAGLGFGVATSYLLGVSTRRVEKLVEQLGVRQLSKSQVSEMAQHLDVQVEAFRNRPLDSSHYTFVWMHALVIKVREHGRTLNVHALIAVGVNADGGREVLGLDICSDEDGAGWLAFLPSLTARGAVRSAAGHLARPPRPRLGHRRRPARRELAAVPHLLSAGAGDPGSPPTRRGRAPGSAPAS
jgi:putative transposase